MNKIIKVFPIEGREDFFKYVIIDSKGNIHKDWEKKDMYFEEFQLEQAERVLDSINKVQKHEAGLKLIAQWEANILFFKERIAIQNEVGYNRHKTVGGLETWERQYCQLDIDREQDKIDKAKQLFLKYEKA